MIANTGRCLPLCRPVDVGRTFDLDYRVLSLPRLELVGSNCALSRDRVVLLTVRMLIRKTVVRETTWLHFSPLLEELMQSSAYYSRGRVDWFLPPDSYIGNVERQIDWAVARVFATKYFCRATFIWMCLVGGLVVGSVANIQICSLAASSMII